jgi:hypothetical protein
MKKKEELDLVWELLHRAMSVIEDMTTLRPPALRIQIGERDWELTLPNYIAIRQIAREALE